MELVLVVGGLGLLAWLVRRAFLRRSGPGSEPSFGPPIATEPAQAAPVTSTLGAAKPWNRTIFLDLETERLAEEVPGGWANIRGFGLAVACTYDDENGYRFWHAPDAEALLEELDQFDRVVGFNLLGFDYEVLSAFVPDVKWRLGRKTVDMLIDIERELGHRVSLDSLAEATLGQRKSATGVLAVEWWRGGLRDRVRDYCRKDVEVTKGIFDHGCGSGTVYFMRDGGRTPVRAGWAAVQSVARPGAYTSLRRTTYPAVCSACGTRTEVPFLPRGHKPVYCSDCFRGRRSLRW